MKKGALEGNFYFFQLYLLQWYASNTADFKVLSGVGTSKFILITQKFD